MEQIYIFKRHGKETGREKGVVSMHGVPMGIPRPEDGVVKDGDEYIVEDVLWDLDAKEIQVICQFVNSAKMDGDRRPHSRACGISPHYHGSECHKNCPTCHGEL